MDRNQIQRAATELQRQLWLERAVLWPNREMSPLNVLDVAAAAHVLELEYLELPEIGGEIFISNGPKFRAAGLIDRQARKFAVATSFPPETVRFTGAHELGHWLFHPYERLHRDRPTDGAHSVQGSRNAIEREADYFAACFLLPRKLLTEFFRFRFGTADGVTVDDRVAFELCPSDHESILHAEESSLDRELAFATCRRFGGKHFPSLSEVFGVSKSAMAIQIKELGFLRWP